MRAVLALVFGLCLFLTACGSGEGTKTSTTTTPPTSVTTSTITITITTTLPPTTSSTSTTSLAPPTTVPASGGPEYVVTAPDGVFRVVDGVASLVVAAPDVMWASDDGMGGVVYYAIPGVTEHLRVGATAPTLIATNATPRFVTLVGGIPTLEISQIQQGECDDADAQHASLVDLETGEYRKFIPCIPLEGWGIHPSSIGGDLSVTVAGGGWPEEDPVWAQLVFRPADMPESITSLRDWDRAATDLLAGLEIDLAANPVAEPCHWCSLQARLSTDGKRLALVAYVPEPGDLGTADWDEFDALPLGEQWRRWEESVGWEIPGRGADVLVRSFDLESGAVLYEQAWPAPASLLDFDGRYLVYQFLGRGYGLGDEIHLIDTETGDEIPINWGPGGPGLYAHVALAVAGEKSG